MSKRVTQHHARAFARASHGRFLLGAAIGTGMAAKAAERGGADFLLALNAGRFRSMGAPSAACLLALRDSNRMVMEFGQAEILTHSSLPVFFGAAAFGGTEFAPLIEQIAAAGFQGVVNFPTCTFLDGRYRQFLEESGVGFGREVALLRAARARGLSTLAYVHTLDEARRMAREGVDIVNIDFGWNMGGSVGVDSGMDMQEAARLAADFVKAVRSIDERIRCTIEGGPIVTPEQMDQVCRAAKADGYIGGSTIDRVPLESAIEMATGAFKTIGSLRRQVDSLERQLNRKITVAALTGLGEGIDRAREQAALAMDSDLPVLIVGAPGTGRDEVAKAIHESRVGRSRWLVSAECQAHASEAMELNLFGCVAGAFPGIAQARNGLLEAARGSTLVLDDAGNLDVTTQRRLLQAVRSGSFWPRGGTAIVPVDVRFIGISRFDPVKPMDAHRFDPDFAHWLGAIRIDLPSLQEHLEDLPILAEKILRIVGNGARARLDPAAYRALLSHHWPGNLRELRSVLQKAALLAGQRAITERDLSPLLKPRAETADQRTTFSSEREWILDGLRKKRFRRAETARYLRISRKTLYNKMVQYGLLGPDKT